MIRKVKYLGKTRKVVLPSDDAIDPARREAYQAAGCPSDWASYLVPGGEPSVFVVRCLSHKERFAVALATARASESQLTEDLYGAMYLACEFALLPESAMTAQELADASPMGVLELGSVIVAESSLREQVKN